MAAGHYESIGALYEQAWFYAPDGPYHDWMISELLGSMQLSSVSSVCDVGGGTGHVAASLAASGQIEAARMCVVEPSSKMAAQAEARGLRVALKDAAEAHRALEGRRTTGSTVLVP